MSFYFVEQIGRATKPETAVEQIGSWETEKVSTVSSSQ